MFTGSADDDRICRNLVAWHTRELVAKPGTAQGGFLRVVSGLILSAPLQASPASGYFLHAR